MPPASNRASLTHLFLSNVLVGALVMYPNIFEVNLVTRGIESLY